MSNLVVSTEQVKAGRALLRWSQRDLADAAGLALGTIARLEAASGPPGGKTSTEEAIRRALAGAGLLFISENGGGEGMRLRERRRGDREAEIA